MFETTKINEKEAWEGPFKNDSSCVLNIIWTQLFFVRLIWAIKKAQLGSSISFGKNVQGSKLYLLQCCQWWPFVSSRSRIDRLLICTHILRRCLVLIWLACLHLLATKLSTKACRKDGSIAVFLYFDAYGLYPKLVNS